MPELIDDERFRDMAARLAHKEELIRLLSEIFRERTSEEWLSVLGGSVPIGRVNSFAEAMDTYAEEYAEQILEWDHPTLGKVRTIGCPIRSPGITPSVRRAPQLGEHAAEVMEMLLGAASLPASDCAHGQPVNEV